MKYIDADLLWKEIDKWVEAMADAVGEYSDGVRFALEHFTFVLDSLQQEQQEVDLEEEITNFIQAHYHIRYDNTLENGNDPLTVFDFEDVARHFYELGKNSK